MSDSSLSAGEIDKLLKLDADLKSGAKLPTDSKASTEDSDLLSATAALREIHQAFRVHHKQLPIGLPETIGKYHIRSVLGVGGFGIVYLAEDRQLKRVVAIKSPLVGRLDSEDDRRRFLREATATAKLDHPNIVPVYDAGLDGDQVYLALAYCPGPGLDAWLKSLDAPVSPRLAAQIVHRLANAIAYSHDQGIIHRDLKPGNVLLFPDSASGIPDFPFVPKISDFGLAKLLDEGEKQTLSMQLQGTPQYMAPEQLIRGHKSNAPSIDIYSLGVLLYRLLVGRTPFQFTSIQEAVKRIDDQRPIAPHVLQPNIPRDLSTITQKCLEKSPSDRYLTAKELADDLDRFLKGRSIRAQAPGVLTNTWRWSKRHPLATCAGILFAALVAAILSQSYRYTRNLAEMNQALTERKTQLLESDSLLRFNLQQLEFALDESESRKREVERGEKQLKRLVYAADVSAAGRAIRNFDPNRAANLLGPYFQSEDSPGGGTAGETVEPEFVARYLWGSLRLRTSEIQTPPQSIWSIAKSTDGRWLAVAGSAGQIALYDLKEAGAKYRVLQSSSSEINAVSFSKDSTLLASAADDGSLTVWEPITRTKLRAWNAHDPGKAAYAVRFSGETHQLVVAGKSKQIGIWNADTTELVHSWLPPLEQPVVECMDVSPDGGIIAVGSTDGYVWAFDPTGKQLAYFPTWGRTKINTLSLLPPAKQEGIAMVVADNFGRLSLIVGEGKEVASLSFQDTIQSIVDLGKDRVLCGDSEGGLSLVKVLRDPSTSEYSGLEIEGSWQHHRASVSSICVVDTADAFAGSSAREDATLGPVPMQIVTGARDGSLWRFYGPSLAFQQEMIRLGDSSQGFRDCGDLTEYPESILQLQGESLARISLSDGTSAQWPTPGHKLGALVHLPQTNRWMVGDSEGRIAVLPELDTASVADLGTLRWEPIFEATQVIELAFLPGRNALLARSGASGWLGVIRDLETGRELFRIGDCVSMGASPDGRWVAVGRRESNAVEVYETESFNRIAVLSGPRSTVEQVAFTRDGRWLVSGAHDRTVRIWRTSDWGLEDRIIVPGSKISAIAISPDSRTLVVGDIAGRVSIWELETRRELIELRQSGLRVIRTEFSPDGQTLLLWTEGNRIDLYKAGARGED